MMAEGSAPTGCAPAQATMFERLDAIAGMSEAALAANAARLADELLAMGEATLESWLSAQGKQPTDGASEGFRLLALHRQGDPSFNACRESCRELVYRCNCARLASDDAEAAHHLRLGAMVARHIMLFIDGKLESAGFGEFCCSSKTLRLNEAKRTVSANRKQEHV
jgi:hypothetical protein